MLDSILKKYRKLVIISIIILTILITLLFFFSWYYLLPVDKNGESINFNIEKGNGQKQIAQKLYDEGLIRNKNAFLIHIQRTDTYNNLQAGIYALSPSMSVQEIVSTISAGKTITEEVQITFPEGITIKGMDALFVENQIFDKGEFEKAANISYEKAYDKYGYNFLDNLDNISHQDTLEGFLFPDTYRFFKNSSVEDAISKMLKLFEDKMKENFDNLSQRDDLLDIITIASILHREAQTEEDMRQVSGVIQNRLENNMILGLDSTIEYATNATTSVELAKEIDENNSPYNTYKHRELPPTPISNPGIQAINATLHPNRHNYLYFIAISDNSVQYSKTIEEHQQKINKYLK